MAVDVSDESSSGSGVSPLPREARPYQGHPAGLVTRMTAAVIDSLVVGGILLAGYFGLAGVMFLIDPRTFSFPQAGLFLSVVMACFVAEVYLALSWWVAGRTYGYLVMGLRLLRHGRHPSFVVSVLRALFCVFLPIGVLWVAVSRHQRSLQDLVLGTSVVYDWQPRAPSHHRITQY